MQVSGLEVAVLRDGNVLGEMTVLGMAQGRSATARCNKVSWVRVLYKHVLDLALVKFPLEQDKLLSLGSNRMGASVKSVGQSLK